MDGEFVEVTFASERRQRVPIEDQGDAFRLCSVAARAEKLSLIRFAVHRRQLRCNLGVSKVGVLPKTLPPIFSRDLAANVEILPRNPAGHCHNSKLQEVDSIELLNSDGLFCMEL